MDTKLCSKCKKVKSTSEFWKRTKSPDGLNYQCKNCVTEAVKEFEAEHPNCHKRYQKKYIASNKVKIRRMGREWAAQKRRKEGAKPRPSRQKDAKRDINGKELNAQPLKQLIEEWENRGNSRVTISGRHSSLERNINRILSGEIEVVREDMVDRILLGIKQEHMWCELYPVIEG